MLNSFLKAPIFEACLVDPLRENLECVYFHKGNAVATNAHILIVQSLEHIHGLPADAIAMLEGKAIHRSSLADLAKCDYFEILDDCVLGSKKSSRSKVKASYETRVVMPNYERVIPSANVALNCFGVQVTQLSQLIKAAFFHPKGAKSTRLYFSGADRGAKVEFEGTDIAHQYGLIMPFRVNSNSDF